MDQFSAQPNIALEFLKKLAELFWRTVYKAIIAVGDKLLVA
jgi:hypothetical protein